MIGLVLLAALLLLALAIYVAMKRKSAAKKQRNIDPPEQNDAMIASSDPESLAFDAAFAKHIAPHTEKYLSTRVAEVSKLNADGSRRLAIIEACRPMEVLRLEVDPKHPLDPTAIAVKRVNGSQLGYLQRRIADELHRDAGEPVSWSALFKHAERRPETNQVTAAVIVLTRSKVDPEEA